MGKKMKLGVLLVLFLSFTNAAFGCDEVRQVIKELEYVPLSDGGLYHNFWGFSRSVLSKHLSEPDEFEEVFGEAFKDKDFNSLLSQISSEVKSELSNTEKREMRLRDDPHFQRSVSSANVLNVFRF